MSHHHTTLKAHKRELSTKGQRRELRENGYVLAVVYGGTKEPSFIYLAAKDIVALRSKGQLLSHMFHLQVEGEKDEKVVLSHVEFEPTRNQIIHIDFRRASRNFRLEVDVPVLFHGQESCAALTSEGGVLNVATHSIRLDCLAEDIPEHVIVDVSHFTMGAVIHGKDVDLPKGVNNISPEKTLASITHPRIVSEETEEKPQQPPQTNASEESGKSES